jgi:hypothetical protein
MEKEMKTINPNAFGSALGSSPSKEFTRMYLPSPSEGLVISDIDNLLHNYISKKTMLLEYKSGETVPPYFSKRGQFSAYKVLHNALTAYDKLNNTNNYLGTNVIWTDIYELHKASVFKINGIPSTKQQVIDLMNFKTFVDPVIFTSHARHTSDCEKNTNKSLLCYICGDVLSGKESDQIEHMKKCGKQMTFD